MYDMQIKYIFNIRSKEDNRIVRVATGTMTQCQKIRGKSDKYYTELVFQKCLKCKKKCKFTYKCLCKTCHQV